METKMKKQFKRQWGYMLCKTKIPNVYQKEQGGYVVRGRFTLPNGNTKDVTRSFPAETPIEARPRITPSEHTSAVLEWLRKKPS
jgi:hypothetical protein